jgi:hypothetical protein
MENLFEKGCLVQLSIGNWKATRKIDKNKLSQMTNNHEWLTATKKLIDPESLKPISKIANSARSYLQSISLPFPINGMVFVPKDMISMVDTKLQEFKNDFNYEVENFSRDYDHLRSAAVSHLGDLFNEMDYPMDAKQKFSFIWRFIVMDVPNGQAGVLSPEVYEREKQKFINTMEEARELAIQSLREEFSQMVGRICERFTDGPNGKPKIFKNTTVNSFYEYFETFKERNIFKDTDLTELVTKAQAILNGTTAKDIRDSDYLKENIKTGMKDVENAMAEILTRPRRKITLN